MTNLLDANTQFTSAKEQHMLRRKNMQLTRTTNVCLHIWVRKTLPWLSFDPNMFIYLFFCLYETTQINLLPPIHTLLQTLYVRQTFDCVCIVGQMSVKKCSPRTTNVFVAPMWQVRDAALGGILPNAIRRN